MRSASHRKKGIRVSDTVVLEKTEKPNPADTFESQSSSPETQNDFNKMHITKLRSIASKAGIEGTSSMKKNDLITGIEQAILNHSFDTSVISAVSSRAKKSTHSVKNIKDRVSDIDQSTLDSAAAVESEQVTTPSSTKNNDSARDHGVVHETKLPAPAQLSFDDDNTVVARKTSRNARNRNRGASTGVANGNGNKGLASSDSVAATVPADNDSAVSDKSVQPVTTHTSSDAQDRTNAHNKRNGAHADNQGHNGQGSQGGQGGQAGQGNGQHNNKNRNHKHSTERNSTSDPASDDNIDSPKDTDNGEDNQPRRQGRRFRDRRRGRDRSRGNSEGTNSSEVDKNVDEEQVVAGILDVRDNYAFLRTTGYLPGPSDVYVSMNLVRKYGLRRGDHIIGSVKVAKDNDSASSSNRQKFNPLISLDLINRKDPEETRKRADFSKLIPLYPNERLRLETQPHIMTTRVIDLIMPIGKGQRALIVSPPKAGKTTILQDIANAIAANNPECYLMVVLVDERPEEVTDMQRSVKGEVISSTFDRPPSDHTAVAELAIERAKRLVEDGQDVVVLLDSITRLGRAYNNSTPASGRILSGGVDSTALYPPKRFLGAARNIEGGGSLTIIATAMVETGSTGDTVIFEEFKGTGNAELKLDRKIAERRVFPAVDVNPSSTRKDELLLSPEEANIVHKLRRLLSGLDSQQAIDLLISQLKKTRNNVEFLMSVSKTTPSIGEES